MVELNKKEKSILRAIIRTFVKTAVPVGSIHLARKSGTGLKPASVRRLMAGLEEKGYLEHPHTSAGRVPTTAGYRYYVDRLVRVHKLQEPAASMIMETIESYDGDVNLLMEKVARVLASISRQLGIIVTPRLYEGIFDRIQIVPVATNKLMVVLSIHSGQINTILMEVRQKVERKAIKQIVNRINQRFHGRPLRYIKDIFADALADMKHEPNGLVQLFLDASDRLFDFERFENYAVTGTKNILQQPEFSDLHRFSTLVDLLEDKNIIIHFMEQRENPPGIKVTIGEEHFEKQIKECSVITSTYRVGNIAGVLGIIGPRRIAYGKIIPLVEFTAQALTRHLSPSNMQ